MDTREAITLAEMVAASGRSTIVLEDVAPVFIPSDYEEYDTNRRKKFDNGSTITIVPLLF